jgi:iron only hydrogenase large subunit-like protein
VEDVREMGETLVEVCFCNAGCSNGGVDERMQFVRLKLRNLSIMVRKMPGIVNALYTEDRSIGDCGDRACL